MSKPTYFQPEIDKKFFTCPHCHTASQIRWSVCTHPDGFHINPQNYIRAGFCCVCNMPTIYCGSQLVYPESYGIDPHDQMPDYAKATFIEAQSVIGKSPRAACMLLRLCLEQLLVEQGFEQKRLVDKINAAAPKGSQLEILFTACRLAGNEFVHAGTLEELNKSELKPEIIASALAQFINLAVEILIAIPNAAEEIKNNFGKA